MLKTMVSALLSGLVMAYAGVAVATPYDHLSEKPYLSVVSSETMTSGSLEFLSTTVTGKNGPFLHAIAADSVSRSVETPNKWDNNFGSLLGGTMPDDELREAFTRVTASIIAPSIAKDGVLPANLLGLREIVRLMSSATAKLQILDFKMARFNPVDQPDNASSPVNRAGSGTAEKLRIISQGTEQATAATRLFRNIKLFIAGNLTALLPLGMVMMIFVFILFRRIEKHT